MPRESKEIKFNIEEMYGMGKGITLSETEAKNLYELLGELFEE